MLDLKAAVGNMPIRARNIEQAIYICQIFHSAGYCWSSGTSYLDQEQLKRCSYPIWFYLQRNTARIAVPQEYYITYTQFLELVERVKFRDSVQFQYPFKQGDLAHLKSDPYKSVVLVTKGNTICFEGVVIRADKLERKIGYSDSHWDYQDFELITDLEITLDVKNN